MSEGAREIIAINRIDLSALTDDGSVCPITNLLDADGDQTDDVSEAVVAIVRVAIDEWHVVILSDYETAQVH